MKKDLFWRVIASLLVVWLFLFLWMSQWYYHGQLRTNKFTGKVYVLRDKDWERWK